jgi:transcriptional regulator with XRE-family HTH domain
MKTKEIRKQVSTNISINLRKYRAIKNISQQKLASKVGVDQSVVARLENGTRKLLAEELPIFAEAFGVSIYELLAENNQIQS